jgi:hypothetical protein
MNGSRTPARRDWQDPSVVERLFVPADFDVPRGFVDDAFVLEPLGAQHNDADYAAWTTSIDHIRATPGFAERSWPRVMTVDENLGDLERHAEDFAARTGFTYTVLDPLDGVVIGCVYIYPARGEGDTIDASVRSWVQATSADLDVPLWRAVTDWLRRDWPFEHVDYAARNERRLSP